MGDDLLDPRVGAYLEQLVPPRPRELTDMERSAAASGFPIIGPVCGHFCYQLALMIKARRVFELGSGFGYSTAWFARAVQENGGGSVEHVVWDAELSRQAQKHLAALGYGGIVRFHVGEAVGVLREATGPFDLIFNDIDKEGYPASLPVISERLRSGGLLLADNGLWSGAVFEPADRSPTTEGVREFTRLLAGDPGWVLSLTPIRDGLIVALKL